MTFTRLPNSFIGLGIGLLQSSTFLAIDAYFTTKRGRAVGVAMAGTGFGQMIMPHLVRYLLDNFDYKGATLILGGLALNGVSSFFFLNNFNFSIVHRRVFRINFIWMQCEYLSRFFIHCVIEDF